MTRKAKIVCTLGPSTDSEAMIENLINAGANVFRMNFSHGTHESHQQLLTRIRSVSAKINKPVAALQDISGPKIRIGEVDGAIMLETGDTLSFVKEVVTGSDAKREVCLTYPEIIDTLKMGDKIYLADGMIKVEVYNTTGNKVDTRVHVGGKLTSRKGVNFPGVKLPIATITEKDKKDLVFGTQIDVDLIALSFVRTKEDILTAKQILKEHGKNTPIFAKIEMIEAMENLDEILDVVDGIMVARGDLGVEFGLPRVPVAQKQIIQKANARGLPVITATQMLKSMMESPYPTRAEVSDVANALLDGTDAVMLSDETAVGHFPVEAVKVLDETIRETQVMYNYYQHKDEDRPVSEAIGVATSILAETIKPDGIIVFTTTGASAHAMAKYRPDARIIVSSPSEETLRKLCVVWGVEPSLSLEKVENSDELVYNFLKEAIAKNIIDQDKKYILTVGAPKSESGSTNMIRVLDREVMQLILDRFGN